jgi:hypothetical protein
VFLEKMDNFCGQPQKWQKWTGLKSYENKTKEPETFMFQAHKLVRVTGFEPAAS